MQWDTYENIEWERVLKGRLMANFYCLRKGVFAAFVMFTCSLACLTTEFGLGLTRKAQLAYYLHKYCSKRPSSPLVLFVVSSSPSTERHRFPPFLI